MMGGHPSPFGLDPCDLDTAMQLLQASPSLRLEGFHFHLMSHQRDAAAQLHLIAAYLRTVQQWRHTYALGPLRVNAGGGFGVDYLAPELSFDWAGFCAGLPALLHEHGTDLHLRLEPGRYVSASCGWYLMEVLDLKRSHGAWFAVARGGTHHFRTPAAQAHDHPFRVLRGARAARVARHPGDPGRPAMHAQGCAGTRPACRRTGTGRLLGLSAGRRVCVEYFAPALSDASGAADGVFADDALHG